MIAEYKLMPHGNFAKILDEQGRLLSVSQLGKQSPVSAWDGFR
jgi:hypothetical protein